MSTPPKTDSTNTTATSEKKKENARQEPATILISFPGKSAIDWARIRDQIVDVLDNTDLVRAGTANKELRRQQTVRTGPMTVPSWSCTGRHVGTTVPWDAPPRRQLGRRISRHGGIREKIRRNMPSGPGARKSERIKLTKVVVHVRSALGVFWLLKEQSVAPTSPTVATHQAHHCKRMLACN